MTDEIKVDARIRIIANEILNGLSRGRLIDKYCEDWGITVAAMDNTYIKRAYQYIRENVKEDLDNIRETNVNRLLEIYNDSYKSGDKSSMFRALDMINRMAGIYEDRQKIELKVTDFKFGFADEIDVEETGA